MQASPQYDHYDVVIIGGAMMGSSVAWWLSRNSEFDGRILVIEKDPSYEFSATARTNSCIRQQFSNPLNIQISQFGGEFIQNFASYLADPSLAPERMLNSYGYLYLADNAPFAEHLQSVANIQNQHGVPTRILAPLDMRQAFPYMNVDDLLLASHNTQNEGLFDGQAIFYAWRREAQRAGVESVHNEVTAIDITNGTVTGIQLDNGHRVTCNHLVNAAGLYAPKIAEMMGMTIPIEPRKRYSFVFSAQDPLECDLPLVIDPSGVHMRSDGANYLAGCPPNVADDVATAPNDHVGDTSLWEEKVWPVLANRVPAFERIRVISEWVCHYDFNTFDQNVFLGTPDGMRNVYFMNGFSGHGLQQSPAVGRGIAELILYGEYRTLDLSPLSIQRLAHNQPYIEHAII